MKNFNRYLIFQSQRGPSQNLVQCEVLKSNEFILTVAMSSNVPTFNSRMVFRKKLGVFTLVFSKFSNNQNSILESYYLFIYLLTNFNNYFRSFITHAVAQEMKQPLSRQNKEHRLPLLIEHRNPVNFFLNQQLGCLNQAGNFILILTPQEIIAIFT